MLIIKFQKEEVDDIIRIYNDCIINYKGLKKIGSDSLGSNTIDKIDKRLIISEKNHYSLLSFGFIMIENDNKDDNIKILRDYVMALNRSEINAQNVSLSVHIRKMERISTILISKLMEEIKKIV